ncbi:helix-turn-helix domain-containing protein [Kitasatospora sp. NPDC058046]|uniref:helix-turn-helix domain-containing protein n=1 Tax=Kitasatospora sp. NPDC058046 TaxID=3346312 RepID=UPI0036DCE25D
MSPVAPARPGTLAPAADHARAARVPVTGRHPDTHHGDPAREEATQSRAPGSGRAAMVVDAVGLPELNASERCVLDLVSCGLAREVVARRLGVGVEQVERVLERMCGRARLPHAAALVARRVLGLRTDGAADLVPGPGPAPEAWVRLLRVVARGFSVADAARLTRIGQEPALRLVAALPREWDTTLEGAVAALVGAGRIRREHLDGEPPHADGAGARRLLIGPRRDMDVHARAAVLGARRAVLVVQEEHLARPLNRWAALVRPDVVTVGVHGPGERVDGRLPPGCPIVHRPQDLLGESATAGRILLVATRDGAQVVADAHRMVPMPVWDVLAVEDVLALEAAGLEADLLSDDRLPAHRRLLLSTVTRVNTESRSHNARAGARLGKLTRLAPSTARGYRLEVTLSAPSRPSSGPALLHAAAARLREAALSPAAGRVGVCCPDDPTARRLITALDSAGPDGTAAPHPVGGLHLSIRQTQAEQRSVLRHLLRAEPVVVASRDPLPAGTPLDALMVMAAARRPWQSLAVLERALAEPGPDLLLMTAPADHTPNPRADASGTADAVTLVRALAALDPALRGNLARWDGSPDEALAAEGPLSWVTVRGDLPDAARTALAAELLGADRNRAPDKPSGPTRTAPRRTARPKPVPRPPLTTRHTPALGRIPGTHLHRLRTGQRLEVGHVGLALGLTTIEVSRIERGGALPDPATAERLLDLYHAGGQDREEILALYRQALDPAGTDGLEDRGQWWERLTWLASSSIGGRIAATAGLPPIAGLGRRLTVLLDSRLLDRCAATSPGRQELTRLQDLAVVRVVPARGPVTPIDVAEFTFTDPGSQAVYASWDSTGVRYRVGPAAAEEVGAGLDTLQAHALHEQRSSDLLQAAVTGALGRWHRPDRTTVEDGHSSSRDPGWSSRPLSAGSADQQVPPGRPPRPGGPAAPLPEETGPHVRPFIR